MIMAGKRLRPVFRISEKKMEALKVLWDTEHIQSLIAKRTGFSRAFVSDIFNGKQPITDDFKFELGRLIGADLNDPREVVRLFEVEWVEHKPLPDNHPKNNQKKYNGEMAFSSYNSVSMMRLKDKASSGERLAAQEPIPAIEYYGSVMPKRCYAKYRYKK